MMPSITLVTTNHCSHFQFCSTNTKRFRCWYARLSLRSRIECFYMICPRLLCVAQSLWWTARWFRRCHLGSNRIGWLASLTWFDWFGLLSLIQGGRLFSRFWRVRSFSPLLWSLLLRYWSFVDQTRWVFRMIWGYWWFCQSMCASFSSGCGCLGRSLRYKACGCFYFLVMQLADWSFDQALNAQGSITMDCSSMFFITFSPILWRWCLILLCFERCFVWFGPCFIPHDRGLDFYSISWELGFDRLSQCEQRIWCTLRDRLLLMGCLFILNWLLILIRLFIVTWRLILIWHFI